jgi:sugar O-acyltransferase (sialic acid O-acetyltransferase NeuD family)
VKSVVVIGAGSHAREVLDVIDAINQDKLKFEVLGYIVDPQYGTIGKLVNGMPILGGYDWLSQHKDKVSVICGVGPPHLRYKLVKRAEALGCHFFSAIHPTSIMTRWVQIGHGVVIASGCILTNQIHIGHHVHINLGCTISHDVYIDDFVTLAPGVHIAGNVTLAKGSCVGIGASIIEKQQIGEWSIIGAGTTVVKNVLANSTVVGVPARVIKERAENWYQK